MLHCEVLGSFDTLSDAPQVHSPGGIPNELEKERAGTPICHVVVALLLVPSIILNYAYIHFQRFELR
ncbi:hypothetical protein [Methanofollis sp. UBA420]|uniref:hypothetical protein n=1 Tax=Methanofollis sp. UBA420 TaxID=1915514 RepID=UPI00316AD101